jgi:hypothetical protein
MKGHLGSITSLAIARASDLLISGSSDTSIRMWDMDLNKELGGYRFYATALRYDNLRDFLFAGTIDGTFAVAKAVRTLGAKNAEISIVKKFSGTKSALVHLWYCTK